MSKRASTFIMIAVVALVMLVVVFLLNRTLILQEGNPLPVFKGIWQIVVDKEPYAEINGEPVKYITRTGEYDALFAAIAESEGVELAAQDDTVCRFEGPGKLVVLTARQYSRSFQVWEVSITP